MKKKDDEMNNARDGEQSLNQEKQEWENVRGDMENKLAEAQNLNASMKEELDRMRDDHTSETQRLRGQMDELQQQQEEQLQRVRDEEQDNSRSGGADSDLLRENEELRNSLQEQQQVTEEVRREAQEFLREMKMLSEQSGSTWEKHAELEKTIERLEHEVQEWRNRYARTKTQLRNMRASSIGLTMDLDASKYVREKGFADDNGLVKDVHVTKFQIAIDELLQKARHEDPDKVIDAMKSVVVSVRRITKDVGASANPDDEAAQQRAKLRAKVSSTANNLITTSKNFAAAAGISPVSLLDAAASHLTAAVVELLQTVKIRATPAEELDDEDEGTMTPVDSAGFFSPRSTGQVSAAPQNGLPPPPPFQGLGGMRASADSSAYSPVNSPRESVDPYNRGQPMQNGDGGMTNGNGYDNMARGPNGYGMHQQANHTEDLKVSTSSYFDGPSPY